MYVGDEKRRNQRFLDWATSVDGVLIGEVIMKENRCVSGVGRFNKYVAYLGCLCLRLL